MHIHVVSLFLSLSAFLFVFQAFFSSYFLTFFFFSSFFLLLFFFFSFFPLLLFSLSDLPNSFFYFFPSPFLSFFLPSLLPPALPSFPPSFSPFLLSFSFPFSLPFLRSYRWCCWMLPSPLWESQGASVIETRDSHMTGLANQTLSWNFESRSKGYRQKWKCYNAFILDTVLSRRLSVCFHPFQPWLFSIPFFSSL